MEITIKPEDINKLVADAVLNSALGKEIHQHVQEVVTNYRFIDVLRNTVQTEISKVAVEMLSTEFKKLLEQKIRTALTEDMINTAVEKLTARMVRDW